MTSIVFIVSITSEGFTIAAERPSYIKSERKYLFKIGLISLGHPLERLLKPTIVFMGGSLSS